MQGNFRACLAFTLSPQQDGQPYHDTPGDNGGPTAYGITQATWARWIGAPASTAAMRTITPNSAASLYFAWFWKPIAGDLLPVGVDIMCFDFGVTAGENTSARHLQTIVGVDVDGDIGPLTMAAVNAQDVRVLIVEMQTAQAAYYRSLDDFDEFGDGWLARTDRRAAAALAMLPTPTT